MSVVAAAMSQYWPLGQFAVVRQPASQMLIEQYWLPLHGVGLPMHDEVPSVELHVVPEPPPPPPPVPLPGLALFVTVQATTVSAVAKKNACEAIERAM
jgi:hypothetical protein